MRTEGRVHLIPNQGVAGSSPAGVANESNKLRNAGSIGGRFRGLKRYQNNSAELRAVRRQLAINPRDAHAITRRCQRDRRPLSTR